MKDFTNDNFINILFFLGLFLLIYALNIFMGTAIFERIVTNLFIYIILVVGLQVFMGNSGILSFAHIGYMIEFLNFP
jgi:branched-chain amino acid transport system permease protein